MFFIFSFRCITDMISATIKLLVFLCLVLSANGCNAQWKESLSSVGVDVESQPTQPTQPVQPTSRTTSKEFESCCFDFTSDSSGRPRCFYPRVGYPERGRPCEEGLKCVDAPGWWFGFCRNMTQFRVTNPATCKRRGQRCGCPMLHRSKTCVDDCCEDGRCGVASGWWDPDFYPGNIDWDNLRCIDPNTPRRYSVTRKYEGPRIKEYEKCCFDHTRPHDRSERGRCFYKRFFPKFRDLPCEEGLKCADVPGFWSGSCRNMTKFRSTNPATCKRRGQSCQCYPDPSRFHDIKETCVDNCCEGSRCGVISDRIQCVDPNMPRTWFNLSPGRVWHSVLLGGDPEDQTAATSELFLKKAVQEENALKREASWPKSFGRRRQSAAESVRNGLSVSFGA